MGLGPTLEQLEEGLGGASGRPSAKAWGTLKAIAGALGVSMVELAKLTAKLESR